MQYGKNTTFPGVCKKGWAIDAGSLVAPHPVHVSKCPRAKIQNPKIAHNVSVVRIYSHVSVSVWLY